MTKFHEDWIRTVPSLEFNSTGNCFVVQGQVTLSSGRGEANAPARLGRRASQSSIQNRGSGPLFDGVRKSGKKKTSGVDKSVGTGDRAQALEEMRKGDQIRDSIVFKTLPLRPREESRSKG